MLPIMWLRATPGWVKRCIEKSAAAVGRKKKMLVPARATNCNVIFTQRKEHQSPVLFVAKAVRFMRYAGLRIPTRNFIPPARMNHVWDETSERDTQRKQKP